MSHRWRTNAMLAGGVGLAACALGAAVDREATARAYLVAYVFWTGVAVGCLGLLMLHHLAGGGWGQAIRRPLEAAARTIPLMALLFIPVALAIRLLYPWAKPDFTSHHEALRFKLAYLNVNGFLIRSTGYFLVWSALAWFITRRGTTDRVRSAMSGPGLALFFLSVSFASIDWIMSLEPEWYSTIFGVLWMIGNGLAALALMIRLVTLRADSEPTPPVLNDLGNLLLAFVMLWAYMSFSQFMIIWSGNLPEEVTWYLHRNQQGWQWLAYLAIAFQFVVPFFVLLSRDAKRKASALGRLASLIFVMHLIASYWVVAPPLRPGGFGVHWTDLAATIGIGGAWLAVFLVQWSSRPQLEHDVGGH